MAKRGRKPKSRTLRNLDKSLRDEINEAIRSHADESASAIYRRFGLQQRGLVFSTFRKHVARIRRDAQDGRIVIDHTPSTAEIGEPAMIAKLRRLVLVQALDDLEAGDTKLYEIVGLLSKLQDFDRIAILQDADKRLDDKHKVWQAQERKRLEQEKRAADTKLDAMAQEHGIPERVTEAVKLLYGIKF